MTIKTAEEAASCAGDGSFETVGLRDDEVRGYATVGPAANGELLRVGDALLYGVIDHGYVVLKIQVAPVGPDRLREVLAMAR